MTEDKNNGVAAVTSARQMPTNALRSAFKACGSEEKFQFLAEITDSMQLRGNMLMLKRAAEEAATRLGIEDENDTIQFMKRMDERT